MNSDFVRIFPSPLVGVGGLQFWHQRVARDVTAALQSASLQQQQQQKDIAKDMLMQGSSTEITMDQPQGRYRRNAKNKRKKVLRRPVKRLLNLEDMSWVFHP